MLAAEGISTTMTEFP